MMTLDQFQSCLRVVFDTTLQRSADAQAAHEAALKTVFDAAEAAELDTTALGGIVNAEIIRFHEELRKLQQKAGEG